MIVVGAGTRTPTISVLIGLVSTEDRARILETLAALENAQDDHTCEVVLVDRRPEDSVTAEIRRTYPAVHLFRAEPSATLPEMRTLALDRSTGDIVAVTEDHCVPCPGWLGAIAAAMEDPAVLAVGGPVENGVHETAFDWATFLCEYSAFSPPAPEGETELLPGMNVAYRRDALCALPRERLIEGFWETTVHGSLRRHGGRFESRNAMKMFHCKKFTKRLFFRQRFVYSRYFAALRFPRSARAARAAATVGSLILPPLLFWRMIRACIRKGLGSQMVRALPALAALTVVWSAGEMWGYMFGQGEALSEIE